MLLVSGVTLIASATAGSAAAPPPPHQLLPVPPPRNSEVLGRCFWDASLPRGLNSFERLQLSGDWPRALPHSL